MVRGMDARSPITVALTHFADLLALGLQAALDSDASVAIVARDIPPTRLDVMLRAHHPRVLLIDADGLRDAARVRELRVAHPRTNLVLLGDGPPGIESTQLLAFGASACLPKETQTRDLLHAIHLASRGLQLQLMPVAGADGPATPEALLTPREGEVLVLLREGRSNAEIAAALQIGVETVRSHARNIYRKLGVSSRRTLLALPGAAAPPAADVADVAHPARRRAAPSRVTRRPRHR